MQGRQWALATLFSALILTTVASNAVATIISGNLVTNGGKAVNLSGLEWLSFDDPTSGTFNVSRDEIDAPGSIWKLEGWRYATTAEYEALIVSLGIMAGGPTNGYYDSNNDGVEFLLATWGKSTISPFETYGNVGQPDEYRFWVNSYRQHWGFLGSIFLQGNNSYSYVGHVQSPLLKGRDYLNDSLFQDTTDYNPAYHYRDVATETNRADPAFGSFLVRGSAANVPEPTTLALLGLGFAGLAASRRR